MHCLKEPWRHRLSRTEFLLLIKSPKNSFFRVFKVKTNNNTNDCKHLE